MDDDQLAAALDGARRGEEQAMVVLFRAYQPQLLRYLRARAGAAAEDLAADTWLALAKALRTIEGGPDELRAWLFSVARRKVVDHYRAEGRRPKTVVLDAGVEHASTDDVEGMALSTLGTQAAVRLLVEGLPPEQAEVVLLRVLGDLSVEQVAQIMGKRPGTVRVLQHRALRRLARTTSRGLTTQRLPG
ncbi:MAG: RNA polymerase sigma factor [Actinomycetota bacterium]|nr:RNA polymerase sigma factor [Actinomycetota bacterium]